MRYIDIKYKIDKIIALLGLIVLSPLMIIIGIAIKLDSPGPIIYRQKRLGQNGKIFYMYKFRSMYEGAEKNGVYDRKKDPRVTSVGKVIRRTSLDELPQLINVLKGDMSLIGPRPPLVYHPWPYEKYTDEQKKMFLIKPGITGWAQVNGRKNLEWDKRIKMNIEYIEKMSLLLDLKILLLTVIKVIKMEENVNRKKTVNINKQIK
ncbi:lipopolysaccharide/colanic/teichoic acid biosynthesis glycosyltransferase [Herbinix hemicellulosilytica]|uniref:Putative membrane protein n=1 Tax=Herbinix hemicellulosilytica TaxID=1564487 RepID=A0A0H5SF94_HERHM|nr:lipopolysaccharide/colanic/teichoic acid biosynthesis glycosyltransferase [Herbinix hemicellulosilytica]CRZ34099.1 putative membrane protein [Herbinix hemicellulosilytica]